MTSAFKKAANELQVPLAIIECEMNAGLALWKKRIILVRPDEFVAFASDTIVQDSQNDNVRYILKKAVGHSV